MARHAVGGRVVGYEVHGDGPALFAVHGTTQARNAWDQVRAACDARVTWIQVDLPGSGESSMPEGPIDLGAVTDDLAHLATALGHETFHVAGYSLGAVVALATASRHADRVASVFSLCGWAQTDARMRMTFDLWRRLLEVSPELFMRYALVDGYTAPALEVLEPMADAAASMAATVVQPGSAAHLELDSRVDIVGELSSISGRCTVVGAVQDRWVDVQKSRDIAAAVPGARLVEIDAGHLVIGERADAVATALSTHLRD